MTSISEAVLLLLLNAAWQITLVVLLACASDRLLRGAAARYRHALWVAALVICVGFSLGSSLHIATKPNPLRGPSSAKVATYTAEAVTIPEPPVEPAQGVTNTSSPRNWFAILRPNVAFRQSVALIIAGVYGLLLLYGCGRLFRAWILTRRIRRSAREVELSSAASQALERCGRIFGRQRVRVLASRLVAVPVTAGTLRPVLIVPEGLARASDLSLLVSALGHEMAHIGRRDYLLNLVYEFASLPLWFHPAMQLMLRRIRQTRELRCDEMVTERLLEPRIYADSLVQLAGAALPFGRPAATITVGIADADILEERIMKILKYSPARAMRRSALVVAALLFVIPCVAIAPFAVHVSIHQPSVSAAVPHTATDPTPSSAQEQASAPKSITLRTADGPATLTAEQAPKVGDTVLVDGRKLKITALTADGQYRAAVLPRSALTQQQAGTEAEARKKAERAEAEGREKTGRTEAEAREKAERAERKAQEGDSEEVRQARRKVEEAELAARAKRQAELAAAAKIPIDQAIQIAQREKPGTVIEARLIGEHGTVAYLVSVLTQNGNESRTAWVLVNAIDGTILQSSKLEQAR